MIIFSEGLSNATNSSNRISILFPLKLMEFGSGLLETNFGGIVSTSPPDGVPILAQAYKTQKTNNIKTVPVNPLRTNNLIFLKAILKAF